MTSAKQIMEEMVEGGKFVTAIMSMETYFRINEEVAEEIAITIRVKSCKYDKDETHCKLLKAITTAKRKLRDYEFKLNNG